MKNDKTMIVWPCASVAALLMIAACGDDGSIGFGGFGGEGTTRGATSATGQGSGATSGNGATSGSGATSGTSAAQSGSGASTTDAATASATTTTNASSADATTASATTTATTASSSAAQSSSSSGVFVEICDNGVDDDGNGAADCDDAACAGAAGCPPASWTCDPDYWDEPAVFELCDCDCGAFDPDCADPTNTIEGCADNEICNTSGQCAPPAPEDCDNGIDDDLDDDADCDDTDCLGEPGCAPLGWTCNPSYWDEPPGSDFCDCDCGAFDPDCSDPTNTIFGCDAGYTCNAAGTCELASGEVCGNTIDDDNDGATDCDDQECLGQPGCAPLGWTCSPSQYDEGFFGSCHCSCGGFDPDCSDPTATVIGCTGAEVCDASGACAPPPPEDCGNAFDDDGDGDTDCDDPDCLGQTGCAPLAWTCNPAYWDESPAFELCDCGCGAPDPDCADGTLASCDICSDTGSCSTSSCPGTIDPLANDKCI